MARNFRQVRPFFTQREHDVLTFVAEGLTNQEIADRLGIERTTVRSHLQHLCDKPDANSRLEAVTIATRLGLISLMAPDAVRRAIVRVALPPRR